MDVKFGPITYLFVILLALGILGLIDCLITLEGKENFPSGAVCQYLLRCSTTNRPFKQYAEFLKDNVTFDSVRYENQECYDTKVACNKRRCSCTSNGTYEVCLESVENGSVYTCVMRLKTPSNTISTQRASVIYSEAGFKDLFGKQVQKNKEITTFEPDNKIEPKHITIIHQTGIKELSITLGVVVPLFCFTILIIIIIIKCGCKVTCRRFNDRTKQENEASQPEIDELVAGIETSKKDNSTFVTISENEATQPEIDELVADNETSRKDISTFVTISDFELEEQQKLLDETENEDGSNVVKKVEEKGMLVRSPSQERACIDFKKDIKPPQERDSEGEAVLSSNSENKLKRRSNIF